MARDKQYRQNTPALLAMRQAHAEAVGALRSELGAAPKDSPANVKASRGRLGGCCDLAKGAGEGELLPGGGFTVYPPPPMTQAPIWEEGEH